MPCPARRRLAPVAALLAVAACDEPGARGELVDDDPLAAVTLPDEPACDGVREWPQDRRERERGLFDAIVAAREHAGHCGALGNFVAADAPDPDGALICAARSFAGYLAQYDKFGHTDGDGNTVVERLRAAGWDPVLATELVAAGDVEPARVVDEMWLPFDAHCAALRAAEWTHIGVAYREDEPPAMPSEDMTTSYGGYWVVVLATPQ